MTKRKTDLGLIIALKEEFAAFAETLGVILVASPAAESGDVFYKFEFVDIDGSSRTGVATFIGDMGESDASAVAERLLSAYPVSLLSVVGLAGLVSDEIKIGQVVVASAADSYMHRGKTTTNGIAGGGEPWPTSQPLLKLVDHLETANPRIFAKWRRMMQDARNEYLSPATVVGLESLKLLPTSAAIAQGPIVTVPVVGGTLAYKEELRLRNRNYLVMEMETAGVLRVAQDRRRPPATLVIRGVSDPADERKKQFDSYDDGGIRKWAISNAFNVLRLMLRDLPLFGSIDQDDVVPKSFKDAVARVNAVSEQHLRAEYRNVSPEDLKRRADAIARSSASSTSVDRIAETLTKNTGYAIRIDGEWGVGKSTLLEAVYHSVATDFQEAGGGALPAYLDVRHYDRIDATADSWLGAAKKALSNDLQPLVDLAKHFPGQSIILIVDGIEEDVNERDEIEKELAFWMRKSPHVRRLMGVARHGFTNVTLPHIADVNEVVKLAPVSLHSAEAVILLEAFAQLNSVSAEDLRRQMAVLEIYDLDVTTMMIGLASLNYRETMSAADVYKSWCLDYLATGDRSANTSDAARLAYLVQFQPQIIQWSELRQNRTWSLTRIHDTVRAFLIASHIVDHLTSDKLKWSRAKEILSRVYSFNVNRFCKDLLNTNQGVQRQTLRMIQKRYERGPAELQITLAYCAGRLSDRTLRVDARRFLRASLAQLLKSLSTPQPSREELMLLRTLFISLIRLDDRAASAEYIDWMLQNRELDDINRGFHLEYYHDIPYNPEYPKGHYDQPTHPCAKTVARLVDRIERAITGRHDGPVEVEIYTLASLAQFRLAHHTLNEHLRLVVLDILNRAAGLVSTAVLTRYLDMLKNHLEAGEFSTAHVFNELVSVKSRARRGWEARGLEHVESVAAHMYGAYLLALCMLPDTGDLDYKKHSVMEMLLVHDLAEAYTGDRLPEEKNEQTRGEDDRVSGYISMMSTYTESVDLFMTYDLWREFEEGTSINARIARDIDKLENWFQLHLYDRGGMKVADRNAFAADLVGKIGTEQGKAILNKFRHFFFGR
jgi:5'-deoxynucleotidase YfbR-like HD superfamily hydrolase/nucleoside phosphorylase